MRTVSALLISIALASKVVNAAGCWSESLGYPCCTTTTYVFETDSNGQWGVENGNWCGIDKSQVDPNCWSAALGFPCCKTTNIVIETDSSGQWGIENNGWCGIVKSNAQPQQPQQPQPQKTTTQQAVQTPPPQRPKQNTNAQIKTNVKKEYKTNFNNGKFEGFGSSFCWWANRVGYSDILSEKAATAFYDKDEGLGLTIIRYNIGGGDNPTHNHITRTDSNIPGYAINPQTNGGYNWQYDWNKDSNQRNALFKAVAKNKEEIIVEGFSNSPPYFMTNSGCTSGAVDSSKNNLRNDAYPAFAKYLADVAEHFKNEWGLTFQSMTPVNEPSSDYWGANSNKQEGCHFDMGDSESKILIELRKALDARGLKEIQISGTDETGIDVQIDAYNRLSNEAKNIITRIDTHTYGGSKRNELRELAEKAKKNLWMSEVDGSNVEGTNAGEMGSALWLANRIIEDLNNLRASAWILWQLIDNHISKDGYNGRRDSGMVNINGGYWGVAVADHDKNEIILTQKYYAFGQFSRYIRPGYTLIGCYNNSIAFYDGEGKKLVIVATNTAGTNKTVDFNLDNFASVGYNVRVIRTSGSMRDGEHWAELPPLVPYGLGFNAELKANSVTTFIVEDVIW